MHGNCKTRELRNAAIGADLPIVDEQGSWTSTTVADTVKLRLHATYGLVNQAHKDTRMAAE